MNITEWAAKWNIPEAAIIDLQRNLYPVNPYKAFEPGPRETDVQNQVRLEASQKGLRLWRNNVGAVIDAETNRHIRYGLANDSKAVNHKIKSADLIGIRPIKITPEYIGATIGQFVSREVKRPDWHYTGTEREQAQLAWAELIFSLGGDAAFATGTGTL